MQRWLSVLLVVCLLMSVNVAGGQKASAAAVPQVFRIGVEWLPQSLDPAEAEAGSATTLVKGMFEGLVRLDAKGLAVPGMAEKWTLSNDGKTYTFTLRPGIKWSNGQPVQAADFEYAWKRALKPDNQFLDAYRLFVLAGAEDYNNGKLKDPGKVGVKALNANTLQVTLVERTSYFLQQLAHPIFFPVNATIVKSNSQWGKSGNTLVTNGPFKLKKWGSNEVVMVKNPNYYAAKAISFTDVSVRVPQAKQGNLNPLTTAYVRGEIDWTGGMDDLSILELDKKARRDLHIMPFGGTYYYQFNINEAPFQNVKIRKALAMSLERSMLDTGIPAFGFVPWSIRGTNKEFRSEFKDNAYFQEDAEQAKKLLNEGLQEMGLTKLPSFTLFINEGQVHDIMAQIILASWRNNLGIQVKVEVLSWSQLLENRQSGRFTLARGGWSADYNDPSSFLEYYTSWSADNDSGWSNPQYDQFIRSAKSTLDSGKRMKLYAQAEKLLMDQMVVLPLYYYQTAVLHKPNIKNVYIGYDKSIDFTRGYIQ